MIKYYVELKRQDNKKQKIFNTYSQAENYYRELQDKYNTTQVIIGCLVR